MRRRQIEAMRQAARVYDVPVAEVSLPVRHEVSKFECPVCGKHFRRGLFMHVKYCKG
jgi:hypothetical protein